MSLLFQQGKLQLVDHVNKTVSCDLYELLVENQTGEEDNFDGQAFELANSNSISEKQIVNKKKAVIVNNNPNLVKLKIDISLEQ